MIYFNFNDALMITFPLFFFAATFCYRVVLALNAVRRGTPLS